MTLIRYLFLVILAFSYSVANAVDADSWAEVLAAGIGLREQGNLELSIGQLAQAAQLATGVEQKRRTAAELGAALLQARRLEQARPHLLEAYAYFSGVERARIAIDLGNLALLNKRDKDAQRYYAEAVQLADTDAGLGLIAELNLLRLSPTADRSAKLAQLFLRISTAPKLTDPGLRARLYLNLGSQAQALGKRNLALAFRSLNLARQLSMGREEGSLRGNLRARLHVEALDSLAQLYEDQGNMDDALRLVQQGLAKAGQLPLGVLGELAVALEWRQARLQLARAREDLALAAYQRAVVRIEQLRQDIPIEFEDGRSSFRQMLEPVYMGLAELLLKEADRQSGPAVEAYLRRARDTIELIKQSELQDYLGDRCSVEAVRRGSSAEGKGGGLDLRSEPVPAGTAILYPIIFSDRVELLLDTASGIVRKTSRVPGAQMRETVLMFAAGLRDGEADYLPRSRLLYDWLLRPFEATFSAQGIATLIVVPDGTLRLVAVGALHDGKRFAIEKFAISTVTGLSITNTTPPPTRPFQSLVAGVSEFGPVVDKLEQGQTVGLPAPLAASRGSSRGLAGKRNLRAVAPSGVGISPGAAPSDASASQTQNRTRALRAALALPGVKDELAAIAPMLPGTSMLNDAFTVDGFKREAEAESHQIIHIASHGVFGGAADSSYILAYDDILTLDGLQSLLTSDPLRKSPIELLTLSACETAEGNDRAPLGISGAAIKARAKSVLGTLWPVDDNAARQVMEKFYRGLMTVRLSKTEALRQAQIELLRSEEFSHPFFWAPFLLVGNWL